MAECAPPGESGPRRHPTAPCQRGHGSQGARRDAQRPLDGSCGSHVYSLMFPSSTLPHPNRNCPPRHGSLPRAVDTLQACRQLPPRGWTPPPGELCQVPCWGPSTGPKVPPPPPNFAHHDPLLGLPAVCCPVLSGQGPHVDQAGRRGNICLLTGHPGVVGPPTSRSLGPAQRPAHRSRRGAHRTSKGREYSLDLRGV